MSNDLTMQNLNGFAISCGFESERERIEMFLSVPQWHEDALWTWLDEDGTKQGLEKILATKRSFPKRALDV
jgi:hypothetical protein